MTVEVTHTVEGEEYWRFVEDDDLQGAAGHASRLMAEGWTATDVIEQLVTPTQHRVGHLWARDRWSVSREHAATALNEAVVRQVGTIRRIGQASTSEPEVLVVCAELEWHALPALAVTALLNDAGLPAVFLGADVPVPNVHHETVRLNTRAVLVSASLASSLPYVQRLVGVVRATRVPVVVGGAAFDPDGLRAAALGATAAAVTGAQLTDVLRDLPSSTTPMQEAGNDAHAEAAHLTARRREIASATMASLRHVQTAQWRDFVGEQLPHLLGALEAALIVNDPGIVSQAWEWFDDVMAARGGDGVAATVRDAVCDGVREYPLASRMLRETSSSQ